MLEGGARRILELLDESVPAPRRGTRLLDQALEQAGLARLPETTPELRAFVRRSLRPILEEELGPRLADEVTGDLEAALSPALRGHATLPAAPSSMRLQKVMMTIPECPPPSSSRIRGEGRTVLVIGADRFGTASLARSLVGSGFSVVTAFEPQEIADALTTGSFHAIVTDEPRALAHASVLRDALRNGTRSVLLVTGCLDPRAFELQLQDGGVDQVFGLPKSATSRDLVATLARATL